MQSAAVRKEIRVSAEFDADASRSESLHAVVPYGDEACESFVIITFPFEPNHNGKRSSLSSSSSARLSSGPAQGKRFRFHPWVLMWSAAAEGNVDELEQLLKIDRQARKADEDRNAVDGATELHSTTLDYNTSNHEGLTLLHVCCFIGPNAVECIRLLLQMGANPNLYDHSGWKPLHVAAACQHADVISLLQKANGRPRAISPTKRAAAPNAKLERGYGIAQPIR